MKEINYEEYQEIQDDNCYDEMSFEEWCSSDSIFYEDASSSEQYVKIKDRYDVDIVYIVDSVENNIVYLSRL